MKQPRFLQSLAYAWAGLIFTVQTQRNARIHVAVGLATMTLAIWLGLGTVQLSLLVLTIAGVFVGEAINTAVEALVDLLSPEWHQRAKVAKDVSAGAVLTLSIAAIVVGLLILGPPLWEIVVGIPQKLGLTPYSLRVLFS